MSALDGLRVLDLSRVLAGPWCTQLLADLGAEVTKVERPGTGDDTRAWGPPFLKDGEGHDTRESAYYCSANRGKRSLTLDIAKPEGQRIARALAAQSDVFVENYKVGDMRRYGLDYETLARENPRLIYCSITGFGQTGPYANRAGYDFMIQAMGGLMSITGERDDLPGGGPQKCGVAVADLMTGLYATVAILAAVQARARSGCGQYIDMALLDTQVGWLANQALNYFVSDTVPRRWGNAHPNLAPYQAFATRDGHVILAVGNDGQFRKFCAVAGIGLADDARFSTNPARLANREALVAGVSAAMQLRTTKEWIAALEAEGVPCGPINTLDHVFDDPQVQARGLQIEIPRRDGPPVPQVANPIRFSRTPIDYTLPPPKLGEHGEAVLRERLGMTADEIRALRDAGVI